MRQTYHLGHIRIAWYLAYYHDIKIPDGSVDGILKLNGKPPTAQRRLRKVHTIKYQTHVPGQQIQVGSKVLKLEIKDEKRIKSLL